MLKETLIATGVFEENEYFEKYCDLIENNKNLSAIAHKTQCHHILPRFYYRYNNLPLDDSSENKVNLLYKDHVLAHYYLYFCFKETRYKLANRYALDIILGSTDISQNLDEIVEDLSSIQQFYETSRELASDNNPMKNKKHKSTHDKKMRSDKVRKKISDTMKDVRKNTNDYISIHKGKEGKRIPPDKLEYFLSQGWEIGVKRGYVRLHKDGKETSVFPEKVSEMLSQGWIIGGKPGRVTPEQRENINKVLRKPVYCVDLNGNMIKEFPSLIEADLWWYNNGYGDIKRKKPSDYKSLSNIIKESATKDCYIENIKWIYKDKQGGDINDKVNTNKTE